MTSVKKNPRGIKFYCKNTLKSTVSIYLFIYLALGIRVQGDIVVPFPSVLCLIIENTDEGFLDLSLCSFKSPLTIRREYDDSILIAPLTFLSIASPVIKIVIFFPVCDPSS